MSKICSKCGESKDESEFYKDSLQTSGLRPDCKACKRLKVKEYALNNPDKIKLRDFKYRSLHPEVGRLSRKKYYNKNKSIFVHYSKKRRLSKTNRTPFWLTDNDYNVIKLYYELSERLTKCLGISHHVDHIIPLQGKIVSGLHVPTNLQVIPHRLNLLKGNKWQTF